jgi:hypothetical protein
MISLKDRIEKYNTVLFIDAFVDHLDLKHIGVLISDTKTEGRPNLQSEETTEIQPGKSQNQSCRNAPKSREDYFFVFDHPTTPPKTRNKPRKFSDLKTCSQNQPLLKAKYGGRFWVENGIMHF